MNSGLPFRRAAREGRLSSPTGSMAPGLMQANLALIPEGLADDFMAFLRANPAPFPLLAHGRAGDPALPELGEDIDLRHDLPRYRLFRQGRRMEDPTDIAGVWRNDLVPFAIGCSLSFEADLVAQGVVLRCHAPGQCCSAFDSGLDLAPVGPFGGRLVVTMRAVRTDQLLLAEQVTRAHPMAHGAPVHSGDPAVIGVDLSRPIDGIGLTDIRAGETAVFWACGVSLERAIAHAAPDLAVTHAPGHMLITDRPAIALATDPATA
ncbi:MAG: D-glutamate cyclase family protein [Pseudorhodobacter sp.]